MINNFWYQKQKPISSLASLSGGAGGMMYFSGGDYEIERSLRFNDDDSPYLSRTPSSAGNKKTFTWSGWAKRSSFNRGVLFGTGTSLGSQEAGIEFDSEVIRCYSYTGSFVFNVTTNARYRDPGAWMHIVFSLDTTQSTSSERARLFVNGEQVTDLASNDQPSQNVDVAHFNTTEEHRIGQLMGSHKFDGYIADVHFVDGTRLDSSSFGETHALTGQWVPKKYSGSHGTNGYHLKFEDNSGTTATTLGKDSSSSSNNYTPNNFSVSAGGGNDSLTDTPTNNFCTLTPLYGYGTTYVTPSNGNLDASLGGTNYQTFTTIAMPPSGKWYAECKFTDVETGRAGIKLATDTTKWGGISYVYDGAIRVDDSEVQTSLSTISDNDIVGIAVDRDANTIQFYKNGSTVGSTVSISATGDYYFTQRRNSSGGGNVVAEWNFGQRDFNNLPSGFKSLCTSNLSDPTIKIPKEYFDSLLYTGNNSTNNITGLEFEPDFVWIKSRVQNYPHYVFDRLRNNFVNNLRVESNNTEPTDGTSLTGVSDGGFSTSGSSGINDSGSGTNGFVAWNWKAGGSASSNSDGTITSSVSANTTAGFSIVTWTGTGSAATIGHGLGASPKWLVVKNRTTSQDWFANNGMIMNDYGKYFKWNTDGSAASDTNVFPNTAPTSTVFSVGTDNAVNGNNDTYVAYCFSEVEGYSKISSYEGIGGTDGPFVYTGFRPSFVMIKNVDSGSRWWVLKTSKIPGYNPHDEALFTNNYNTETDESSIDILSNGFKVRNNGSYTNENNATHMYMAFAENPLKYANAR